MPSRLFSAALALGIASIVGSACGTGGDSLFASGGAGPTSSSSGGNATSNGGTSAEGGGGSISNGGTSASGGATSNGGGGARATGGSSATGGAPSTGGANPGGGGSAPGCGDGVVEPPEVCDGRDLNHHDCTDFGFKNPDGLACAADCTKFDSSGCHAKCGNGLTEPGETCDDGNTMSGDGCSSTCQTEIVAGSTCANAIPIDLESGNPTAFYTTTGGGSHTGTACPSDGPDIVFAVTVPSDGFLTANLERESTGYDSVLYAAKTCDDAGPMETLGCNDSHAAAGDPALLGGEVISFRAQHGTTYYVFVDGPTAGDSGHFGIHFDLSTGADCDHPVPIPLASGSPMTISGSTNGNPMNEQGSCGGMPGSEVVYAITTPAIAGLKVATANVDYNAVLYARGTCNSGLNQFACSNSGGSGANETITIPMQDTGTTLALFVDGSTIGGGPANGNYQLVMTPP